MVLATVKYGIGCNMDWQKWKLLTFGNILRGHLTLTWSRSPIWGHEKIGLTNQIGYASFCKLYTKIKSKLGVNLVLRHFRCNTVFHAVSCLLVCLPELSVDNNSPSTTSYTLLRAIRWHSCFNVLTNIDLIGSILTRSYVCA